MQWKDVALKVIAEQVADGPYEANGRLQFIRAGVESSYSYGAGKTYNYTSWAFAGYLFCLTDNMTWMPSSGAIASLAHMPPGIYWLSEDRFESKAMGLIFMRTHGSLKKFDEKLSVLINDGATLLLRPTRMKVEL